jgi:hypothetical protein
MVILAGAATLVASSRAEAAIRPGYAAARAQWLGDAEVVSGAGQNTALLLAVADLNRGERTDVNSSGYAVTIAAITSFAFLPLTSATPAQSARASADIAKVNRFFQLRGNSWDSGCIASGHGMTAAASAWSMEPNTAVHGALPGPLKTAASDLAAGERSDRGDRSCYPAAIADLANLESASQSEIAAANPLRWSLGSAEVIGAEIAYLNGFFLAGGAQHPVLTTRGQL